MKAEAKEMQVRINCPIPSLESPGSQANTSVWVQGKHSTLICDEFTQGSCKVLQRLRAENNNPMQREKCIFNHADLRGISPADSGEEEKLDYNTMIETVKFTASSKKKSKNTLSQQEGEDIFDLVGEFTQGVEIKTTIGHASKEIHVDEARIRYLQEILATKDLMEKLPAGTMRIFTTKDLHLLLTADLFARGDLFNLSVEEACTLLVEILKEKKD